MAGVAKLYSPAVVNVTPYNKLNIGVPADMDQLVKGILYTGRHCLVHQGGVQREESSGQGRGDLHGLGGGEEMYQQDRCSTICIYRSGRSGSLFWS